MEPIDPAYAFPERRAQCESACDPFHYDTVAQETDYASWSGRDSVTDDHLRPQPSLPLTQNESGSDASEKVASSPSLLQAEYVQALHGYSSATSGSNVCLSFGAGQLIKVLNKDSSGWWDGESEGKRGWFPSNYVTSEVITSREPVSLVISHDEEARAIEAEPMRRAASTPAPILDDTLLIEPNSPAFDAAGPSAPDKGITASILHAIALMQKAVDASRLSHFAPAATCLIASVRSVLSATDCLARESVILRTHLILARERKQILSILAGLVTQARRAALPNLSKLDRTSEMETMLAMAENVHRNVEHFLNTATKCGVEIPAKVEHTGDTFQGQQLLRLEDVSTPNLDACMQLFPDDKSVKLEMPPSALASNSSHKSLHKARSLSDMKFPKRKPSEASSSSNSNANASGSVPTNTRHSSQYGSPSSKAPFSPHLPKHPTPASMIRRPSIPAVYTPSIISPAWQASDSISSCTSSISVGSSGGPLTPAGNTLSQQPVEVYRILSLIHDGLLSTIAAFIGHVHAHSRSSHSSSYAHLIDMTRDSIDRVREELLIIDVISKHPTIQLQAHNVKFLERNREHLYVATTALVTAARKATAPTPLDLADEMIVREQEDQEKDALIKAATSVLRTSADLVNATKPILLKKGLDRVTFIIDFLQNSRQTPSRSNSISSQSIVDEEKTLQANIVQKDFPDDQRLLVQGEKGRHNTLSMLERKTNSLIKVRDHFDLEREVSAAESPAFRENEDGGTNDSSAPDKVAAWQLQLPQRNEQGDQYPTESSTHSARNSINLSRFDDRSERSHSSLSTRRGIPVPANLHVHQAPILHSRTLSFGSMSATSTVTSLREKAATPSNPETTAPTLESQIVSPSTPSSPGSVYRAGGESMSRDESSRGSATSTVTSFQSAFSEANTAETSPRSSAAFPSPAEEKIEYQLIPESLSRRAPRPDFLRARSGSTPDRITVLRISEAKDHHLLPSPLSSRPPANGLLSQQPEPSANKSWFMERDYLPKACEFSNDGNVRGASLRCLIERMTLHDQTIDPVFSNTFFLTFRMFTSPSEVVNSLIIRFNLTPPASPPLSENELQTWQDKKVIPVRLRIYNFFKIWLESHWRPETDCPILDRLLSFTREKMALTMAAPAQRLVDLVYKRNLISGCGGPGRSRGLTRVASSEKLKAGKPVFDGQPLASATFPGTHSSLPPSPIVSKSLFSALRTPPFAPSTILDFDPLELSRQFTIMESKLFCVIQPEELIGQQFGDRSTNRASTIRMMSSLSTRITGWIAEIILSEQDAKKRTALVKYFIKLGDRCFSLQNYNTLMAILAALNSSTISRLKKTWEGLSNKHKATLEILRKATEHTRNYAEYRGNIRGAIAPCLPFLGLYLTDITFCYDGNPAYRTSPLDSSLRLINFDRYQKIAKYVGDLQRFQQPYNLIEVPEIQSFLQAALTNVENGGDVQALYRRSLMVEPRNNANEQKAYPSVSGKDFFNWRA